MRGKKPRRSITAGLLFALALAAWPAWAADKEPPNPKAELCELRIEGHSIASLRLESQGASPKTFVPPDKILHLPAGTYRVERVKLEGGYEASSSLDNAWFSLASDQPHTLRAGAPLSPTVRVTRQGRYLQLNYELIDAAGRSYLQSNRGPARSPAPRFSVWVDGREIGSGSFRYG